MTASEALEVALPARVTVRCAACGHVRSSLVLHDNAMQRMQRCERCGDAAEVVASLPAHAFACQCCG